MHTLAWTTERMFCNFKPDLYKEGFASFQVLFVMAVSLWIIYIHSGHPSLWASSIPYKTPFQIQQEILSQKISQRATERDLQLPHIAEHTHKTYTTLKEKVEHGKNCIPQFPLQCKFGPSS